MTKPSAKLDGHSNECIMCGRLLVDILPSYWWNGGPGKPATSGQHP